MNTSTHHPSESTIAAYAAGTLDQARRLLVATHVSSCAACRHAVGTLHHVGGHFLDTLPPTTMRADALVRAMERLDPLRSAPEPAPPTSTGDTPPSLESYATGPWRWLGLGIRQRVLSVPSDDDIRVFLLRAEPGTRLLHHRHRGIEWTCVLEGAYSHDGGRFGAGDFEEADETVDHKLVVGPDAPCLCLVALERRLLLQGWLGRVLQPLIRI